MNSKQRVMAAINHTKVDKIPKGELWLEGDLIKIILNKENITLEDEIEAYKMLNMDLRVIMLNYKCKIEDNDYSSIVFSGFEKLQLNILKEWHQKSDLFIMAGISGPFESLSFLLGFEKLMFMIKKNPNTLIKLIEKWTDFIIENLIDIINHGANGILIADDIAYNQSTYMSITHMQYLLFPFYKRVVSILKKRNIPVFFHCDGNITNIISHLIDIGFSGLHSLEKESNMDILNIKNQFGKDICLMGNISMSLLIEGKVLEIEKQVNSLIDEFGINGGFILGTSAGVLGAEIPIKSLYAMKNTC